MPFEVAPQVEELTTKEVGRIALDAVARHIRTIPDHLFNMQVWRCGTVGCAIGHSRGLPEVQATGMRYDSQGMPIAPGMTGTQAVAFYFHQSQDAMLDMFGASEENRHRTGPQVAARISEYLERTA